MNSRGVITCPECGRETDWPHRCECKKTEAMELVLDEAFGPALKEYLKGLGDNVRNLIDKMHGFASGWIARRNVNGSGGPT